MKDRHQSLALLAFAILTTAQQELDYGTNPSINVSSCEAISCSPPIGSICSSGDLPGPEIGVGMVEHAVNTSSTTFSLTLIDGFDENGFTGIAGQDYEHSDLQLFVGLNPSLRGDYPTGCALMMQYHGQTFPLESLLVEDARDENDEGTTSCNGVMDVFCRSAIVNMIRRFNSSEEETDQCGRLTQHVNSNLRGYPGACGDEGTWIANFMNVTGGALPGLNSTPAINDRLGDDNCKPVLPLSYQLYKVAEMRQFTFVNPPESEFHDGLFGGRFGFTPVITVLYGNEGGAEPEVQFSCMQTLGRSGDSRGVEGSAIRSRLTLLILGVGLLFAL